MIDADAWLRHPQDLLTSRAPSPTERRRSVSASYYGLFHAIAASCAEVFGSTAAGTKVLIQRSLSHDRLRTIAAETVKRVPGRELAPYWPQGGFGPELRLVALAVDELQQQRHRADYDPATEISLVAARLASEAANRAVVALASSPSEQRELWLSLLVFKPYSR